MGFIVVVRLEILIQIGRFARIRASVWGREAAGKGHEPGGLACGGEGLRTWRMSTVRCLWVVFTLSADPRRYACRAHYVSR